MYRTWVLDEPVMRRKVSVTWPAVNALETLLPWQMVPDGPEQGGGHDAFGARKSNPSVKTLRLCVRCGRNLTKLDQLADQWRHPVVSQAARVGSRR